MAENGNDGEAASAVKPEPEAPTVKAEPGDRKRARPAGGDGDAVDEDKLTLAEFAQRRGITVRKELPDRGPRKPAAGAQAKERTASRRSTSRTSSASSRSGASAPAGAAPWDIRHAPDRKQHIVTRILIRWNYCIEWPNENAMLECASQRKPGFRALPGYPGIFVGVRNDVMGQYDRHSMPELEFEGVRYKPSRAALSSLPLPKLLVLWGLACTNQLPPLQESVEAGDSYGDHATLRNLRQERDYVLNLLRKLSAAARNKLLASLSAELEARRGEGTWNVAFLEQQVDIAKGSAAPAPAPAPAAAKDAAAVDQQES